MKLHRLPEFGTIHGSSVLPVLVAAVTILNVRCGSETKCKEGTETCQCYGNLTCNTGLTCYSGLCVNTGGQVPRLDGGATGDADARATSPDSPLTVSPADVANWEAPSISPPTDAAVVDTVIPPALDGNEARQQDAPMGFDSPQDRSSERLSPPEVFGPALCGDNIVVPPEQCDDGNTMPLDGCSEDCRLEPSCIVGGGCTSTCGDGLVVGEPCDDGNTRSGDGCSTDCQVEPGWICLQPPIGDSMKVPVIHRDFRKQNPFDFEGGVTGSYNATTGIVATSLNDKGA